jgi:putative SOS response-associated peptidase YedK
MCGRFTLKTPVEALAETFELPAVPELQARFNIAPSEAIATVRVADKDAPRELARCIRPGPTIRRSATG